jgi:hypothetical protein
MYVYMYLRICTYMYIYITPFSHAMKAHRESRGIALLFSDLDTRRGWGVSVTPRPLSTPVNDPIPIVQEAGWTPGPVWTGAEISHPTGIRSPDGPASSQLLYLLSYPPPPHIYIYVYTHICMCMYVLCTLHLCVSANFVVIIIVVVVVVVVFVDLYFQRDPECRTVLHQAVCPVRAEIFAFHNPKFPILDPDRGCVHWCARTRLHGVITGNSTALSWLILNVIWGVVLPFRSISAFSCTVTCTCIVMDIWKGISTVCFLRDITDICVQNCSLVRSELFTLLPCNFLFVSRVPLLHALLRRGHWANPTSTDNLAIYLANCHQFIILCTTSWHTS